MTAVLEKPMDINQIRDIIPHRYPFLLIDRITELEPGVKGVGYKNITANEPFFQGHFPGNPIMPGVLIIEAMAQVGCVVMLVKEENKGKIGMFAGIDGVRFKKPVLPGDRLDLSVELLKMKGPIGRFKGSAKVDGQIAAEAEVMFALAPKPEDRSV